MNNKIIEKSVIVFITSIILLSYFSVFGRVVVTPNLRSRDLYNGTLAWDLSVGAGSSSMTINPTLYNANTGERVPFSTNCLPKTPRGGNCILTTELRWIIAPNSEGIFQIKGGVFSLFQTDAYFKAGNVWISTGADGNVLDYSVLQSETLY